MAASVSGKPVPPDGREEGFQDQKENERVGRSGFDSKKVLRYPGVSGERYRTPFIFQLFEFSQVKE
jgi:hypothetical protein